MYKKSEMIVKSRVDALELSVLMLIPEIKPCQGVVQIVHGMCEYKERYLPLMEFLAEYGYASVIHDHRGHGKSVKAISDLGYMYEAGMKGFMDDVLLINEFVHTHFPDIPVIVFGHSMGSLAARVFLREHDDCMDALILSGPPCKNGAVDMGILIAKLQKSYKGAKSPGKLLKAISFGGYEKSFKQENSKNAWLCSDKAVVKQYEEDRYCGFTFSADGYLVLLNLLKYTYLKTGWQCKQPDMPVLYLGGMQDPCIGGKGNFEREMMVLKHAGYNNITGKLYDSMRHEICNELDKRQVFLDILNFLDKRQKSVL